MLFYSLARVQDMEEIIPQYSVSEEKAINNKAYHLTQLLSLLRQGFIVQTSHPSRDLQPLKAPLPSTPLCAPYIFLGAFLTTSLAAVSRYPSSINLSTKSTIQSWQFFTYTHTPHC
jgi:hypothetical protein